VSGDSARGVGTITKGTLGTEIGYDAAGRRATATSRETMVGYEDVPLENDPFETQQVAVNYTGDRREHYQYNADGYLDQVNVSKQDYNSNTNQAETYFTAQVRRADYVRDSIGRVTAYTEWDEAAFIAYSRDAVFNARNEVVSDVVVARQSDGKKTTTNSSYSYIQAGAYLGGAVASVSTTGTLRLADGSYGTAPDPSQTTYSYTWADDARLASTSLDRNTSSSSNALWSETRSYDAGGRLASVAVTEDLVASRSRTISYVSDALGQVLSRVEQDQSSTGDPKDLHYYFDGMKIGDISNNGTSDTDYATAIQNRYASSTSTPWRNNGSSVPHADFDQSYDPINPTSQGASATGSRYTVRDGDSLRSIARNVWGDETLWYIIADANALTDL
jgi:LysM repeat protein